MDHILHQIDLILCGVPIIVLLVEKKYQKNKRKNKKLISTSAKRQNRRHVERIHLLISCALLVTC
jgi:hypothetical protein